MEILDIAAIVALIGWVLAGFFFLLWVGQDEVSKIRERQAEYWRQRAEHARLRLLDREDRERRHRRLVARLGEERSWN